MMIEDVIHNAQTWRQSEVWMPHAMVFVHCITNTYPESQPTQQQIYHNRRFFVLLEKVLPCLRCRKYYHEFLKKRPLTDRVMGGGRGIMREWIYGLYVFLVQKGVLEPGAVGRSCDEIDDKILQQCQRQYTDKKLFGEVEGRVWRYTRVWGPHAWVFLHSVANTFPSRPTPAHREIYRDFFDCLVYVLPCKICREHYARWLRIEPLSFAVISRRSLQSWVSNLHNHVNQRLEKKIIPDRREGQKQILLYALASP
jgi:hypothetical protein